MTTEWMTSSSYANWSSAAPPYGGGDDDDDPLDPVATNIRIAKGVSKGLYLMFGALGIVGNLAVIATIANMKKLSKLHTYKLIMSQSVVDTLASVFILTSTLTSNNSGGGEVRYLQGWWDDIYCRFWTTGYPLWSMFMSSTYSLLLITGERYLAIVHPIEHRCWLTNRKLAVAVLCSWSFGPVYNLLTRVPTSGLINGKCGRYVFWPSRTWEKAFGVIALQLQFFIPIMIHVISYTKMIKVLRYKIQPLDPGENKSRARIDRSTRALFRTMVTITICFFLCWVMNQVNFLLFNFGHGLSFSSIFYHVTVYAAFSNCFVNPAVYAVRAVTEYRRRATLGPDGGSSTGGTGGGITNSITAPTS